MPSYYCLHCSLDRALTQRYCCVDMVPAFDTDGNLPPGIHLVPWTDFARRYGTTQHRQKLLSGIEAALLVLKDAGCRRVYVDGSFITEKRVPNDYDAAWDPTGVDLVKLLSLEPVFQDFDNGCAAQKTKFLGEFFPSSLQEASVGKTVLDFFQIDKITGSAKGIIALDL